MKTLSALYCTYNEQDFIKGSIELVLPYVDEVIVVDNGSTDRTKEIILNLKSPKIQLYDYPRTEPVDMGEVRSFSLSKATGDWFLQVDADEYYPKESLEKIREAIEGAKEEISFRVKYCNLAWRQGYTQKPFGHYPDRLYRRDVVEKYAGVLPNDMTRVKKEFLNAPVKSKGDVGVLEYDNFEDESFIHPRQPILDVYFYHLARTRGYNYEYQKQIRYQKNIHPEWTEEQCRESALINHWVTGRYDTEEVVVPKGIPTKTIPNPKVSIIITNFEYEKWVGEAIQSALNQTYKAHEIIVIDDCSYDYSRDVIEKYPVTKVFRKENGGPAAARNEGIALSTGDYFVLLDADDRLRPDAVEQMLKESSNAEVVYGDLQWIGDRNEPWSFPDYDKEKMLEASLVPSVCALVDRHAFDCSGGFNIDCYFEDYFFWLTLSHTLDLKFKHIPVTTLEYRAHGKCRSDLSNANRDQAREYFKRYFKIKW